MKPAALVLCLVTCTLLIACTQSAPTQSTNANTAAPKSPTTSATATPDSASLARAQYAKHCEGCHGQTGEGGLVKVDDKRLKVPSFKVGHALKHADEDFIKQITKGGDGMPSFKDKLKPEEMQALVKLIRTQFQGK
ncbi:MAG: hypothetical protein C5B55_11000 [Blastocatellia bacterium]|nr:MAG: hypothetical protein C5B55_11000 [Blastocatellia bacterium]